MHQAHTTPPQAQLTSRQLLWRLSPLAVLLALTVFPFEWLGAYWPTLGHAIDHTFPTEVYHSIGHATLFSFLGLVTQALLPALRRRPWRYFGLLMLAGLGQEALQLAFKQRAPAFDDARDLLVDLLGLTAAFALVWLWRRASLRGVTDE